MPFVTIAEAQEAASMVTSRRQMSVAFLLRESRDSPATARFDIFLSHSSMDREYVLGVKQIFEHKSYTVYVDWIDDPQLNRAAVNKGTADTIRLRMRQSKNLVYLHTPNSTLSKWCPWELGYFDAFSHPDERVYVFPLVTVRGQSFTGQEYLSLYKLIEVTNPLVMNNQQSDIIIGSRAA